MTTAVAITSNITNGVDLDRLTGTIEAITQDPSLAHFQFRADNQWNDGGHNRTTIKGFYGAGKEDDTRTESFVLEADEPDVLLGTNKGANPVEHLLHALASCMTTAMVYHAAARGISLESVESHLEGELDLHGFLGLDENVSPGYESIRVTFRVKADASAEELEELVKYSPVFSTVCRPVAVKAKVEIIE